jgi:hypothetical protein
MANEKGSGFERDEARFLSLWWTEGERDDVFWRNRVKVTSKTPNAERQLGDICVAHTIGLPFIETFNVELKSGYSYFNAKRAKKENDAINAKRIANGKEPIPLTVRNTPWDLLDVIDRNVKDENLEIIQFWNQCKTDADLSGRIPLLIFKRDYKLPVVCVEVETMRDIADLSGVLLCRRLILTEGDDVRILYRHTDFFNWLRPEVVRLVHQQRTAK